VLLVEVDGAAGVVGVAVRQRENIDPLDLPLAFGELRVVEPGIYVDALAARSVEAKAGVTEPGERDVGRGVEPNEGLSDVAANLWPMWQTCTGASAMAVEVAAALLLATAASDALGFAGASFYLLVAGVPVTAAAGLICFARAVDAMEGGRMDSLGRLQASLSALLVGAIVVGAAIREPAIGTDRVPREATAVLAFGFALLVLQALIALLPVGRERPEDIGAHRIPLAFDHERLELLDAGREAERGVAGFADHDLARARLSFEPRRDVDRVAGDGEVAPAS
jgi:hypothetical protein